MNRRRFVKTGLIGGAVLTAAGAWVVWRDMRDADGGGPSRDRIALILGAIAPALLESVSPTDSQQRTAEIDRIVAGVKAVIAVFPLAVQKELGDLFRLLDIRLSRRLLTGVSTEWGGADPAEVAAFLESWRTSRIGLLQSGYFALHDLVLGAWYADASTWAAIGYPGPPKVE